MIKRYTSAIGRRVINYYNRKRLKNKSCTIFSSNCNGGIIYHDLGIRMNSPTINLYIHPKDFIRFLNDLEYYLSLDLTKNETESMIAGFPVGNLDDIQIYFVHYSNFCEAKNKWEERKTRVRLDNYCAIMTERDGCTYNDLKAFDELECKKIVFTHKKYPEILSSFLVKGFENEKEVGIMTDMRGYLGKRPLDQYDYVKLINSCIDIDR